MVSEQKPFVQSLPTNNSKAENIFVSPNRRCWRPCLMTCYPLYPKYSTVLSHNLLHRSRMSTIVSSIIMKKDNSHFPSCPHLNLVTTGVIKFKTLLVLLLWPSQTLISRSVCSTTLWRQSFQMNNLQLIFLPIYTCKLYIMTSTIISKFSNYNIGDHCLWLKNSAIKHKLALKNFVRV